MANWIKDILIFLGAFVALLGVIVFALLWLTRPCCGENPNKEAIVDRDLRRLTSALRTYKLNASRYPSTEQGFQALATKPLGEPRPRRWTRLIDRPPLDPWDHPYLYNLAGPRDLHSFTLRSSGEDGIPFTTDDIVRIVN